MRTLLISDTHLNHGKIVTYCDRPENFTALILKRWNERVSSKDVVIHLGDVAIGKSSLIKSQMESLNGKKILVRGNHDLRHGLHWWMNNGFDFACDSMIFCGCWLTHHPAVALPEGCNLNLHGHLHNIWDGFAPDDGAEEAATQTRKLYFPWRRLFAVEYTDYCPVEFEEFVRHPDKYQARGPQRRNNEQGF